jgi:SAM-dependent methyltransferase
MLALHLCAAPAWPFSSSSKPTPTPAPTSATSALEASCKEHTERYHKYEWLGDCPEPRDFGARDDPAHFVAYEGCRATLPTRGCAVAIPPNYVEPPTSDDPAKLRLFDPHPSSIHWTRYPTYPNNEGADGWSAAGSRGKQGTVDCFQCFSFAGDRAIWEKYVRVLMKPAIPDLGGPRVRTVLDLGAGAGGLLAVLQHRYGMQGVGVTMDGPNSPYLETMAARGVIGLRASLSDRLPFQDGAFDLIHSRLSGLRFAESEGTSGGKRRDGAKVARQRDGARAAKAAGGRRSDFTALDSAVMEWDRLVRPGGYLMQTAWKIGRGPQHWNRTATHFLGLANRLGWKPLLLIAPSDHKRKSNSIEFVYQKPLKRP